jgi:6-phospho-3-hexuloisomerase
MTDEPLDIFRSQLDELADVLTRVRVDQFHTATEMIAVAPRIFLVGRGRNGLAIRGFGNRLAQLGRPVAIIGDILTGPVERGDLVVIASASGSSSALLNMVTIAQSVGGVALTLTGREDTPMAVHGDATLTVPASLKDGDPSRQPLGTLFEQALALVCDAMIIALMTRLGVTVEAMRTRHANIE